MFDHDPSTDTYWIRQSAIDTSTACLERARLAVVAPEFLTETDAANAGTAAHAAVEAYYRGVLKRGDIVPFTRELATELATEGVPQDDGSRKPLVYKKWDGPEAFVAHAVAGAEAWVNDIAPHVPQPNPDAVTPEVQFQVVLFERPDGKRVGVRGTIDLVADGLYDWKFPGSEYRQQDKQRSAIQPTVYCAAARRLFGFEYPMTFTYGICVHKDTAKGPSSKGYLFDVRRTIGHERLLFDQLNRLVDFYDRLGVDSPWPLNDTGWLCSERWCDHYSICVGAYVPQSDRTWKP